MPEALWAWAGRADTSYEINSLFVPQRRTLNLNRARDGSRHPPPPRRNVRWLVSLMLMAIPRLPHPSCQHASVNAN